MSLKEYKKLHDQLSRSFDKQYGCDVSPFTKAAIIYNLISYGIENGKKAKRRKR